MDTKVVFEPRQEIRLGQPFKRGRFAIGRPGDSGVISQVVGDYAWVRLASEREDHSFWFEELMLVGEADC